MRSDGTPTGTRGGIGGIALLGQELARQGERRLGQDQADGVDELNLLQLQLRQLRPDGFDLRGGRGRVEARHEAALLARPHHPEHILVDLDVGEVDADLVLRAAQLHVIARQFGEVRHQGVAPALGRAVGLCLRGLDRSAHPAPKIEFPGGVEAGRIALERRADRTRQGGRHRAALADQADDAVLAILLAQGRAGPVDGRQGCGGGTAELRPAFGQTQRRGAHVEVLVGDARLEPRQQGIVEHAPPFGVGLGRRGAGQDRQGRAGRFAGIEVGPARRDLGQGRDEFRADRAAPDEDGRGRRGGTPEGEAHGQCPPPPPLAVFFEIRMQSGATRNATTAA